MNQTTKQTLQLLAEQLACLMEAEEQLLLSRAALQELAAITPTRRVKK